MSNLLLYHAVPSRSMTVRWMLEEIGEPYDIHLLDMGDALEQKDPEYLAVNPLGRVPALRHNDVLVTETAAICLYLAEQFPRAGLNVPVESPDRGAFLRWMFIPPVTIEPSILWAGLGDSASQMEYQPFADIQSVAELLRLRLEDAAYIVGDRFTAADVLVGASIMWGTTMFPEMPRFPALREYWERLSQRPGWQRASDADSALMREKNA